MQRLYPSPLLTCGKDVKKKKKKRQTWPQPSMLLGLNKKAKLYAQNTLKQPCHMFSSDCLSVTYYAAVERNEEQRQKRQSRRTAAFVFAW